MTSRAHLEQLAQETLEILRHGQYVAPSGRIVHLAREQTQAERDTMHYAPEDFDEVVRRRDERLQSTPCQETFFRVVNQTTLRTARALLLEDAQQEVCCLNFASAKNPGGGFLKGARAQEESLARSSGLFSCLVQKQAMYRTNRVCGTCLYTDHMIYSPRVPVFRDDDGTLLEEPYLVSFLTAPAVNVGALREDEHHLIKPTMVARMEKMLSLALLHDQTTLVLGAWGCGVFRNDTNQVAEWFRWHLIDNPTFRGRFRQVVFAITDWSDERRFIQPFADRFGGIR